MPYTDDQIKNYVSKLQEKGAPTADIETFVASAVKERGGTAPQEKSGLLSWLKNTSVGKLGQTVGEAVATKTKDYKEAAESQQNLDDLNVRLGQTIIKNKALGRNTSHLEQQYKINTGRVFKPEEIASSLNKSVKEIAGEALGTFGTVLMGANPGGSVAARIGQGAALGGVSGAGGAMQEDKSTEDVLVSGIKGASIGAVISGAFEAIGAGLRGLSKTKGIQNKTANTYNKELEPPIKDLKKQIENTPIGQAFKTTGAKIRDAVDDNGQPLYVGTYSTILDKAKITVKQKGEQLSSLLKSYDNKVVINKNEVAGDIISEMQDRMGRLSSTELKVIKSEVNRITENSITPTKALEYKRLYDSKIPDSFWSDTADRTKAVAVQSRYILRDNLRKLISGKTGDDAVKALNESMGLAMDVRRLSASQIALRATEKIGAGGQGAMSVWRAIQGLIDDTVFNPAITTRVAQGLRGKKIMGISTMGSKTGQTPLRSAARNVIINQTSK